jgi:hypothetical protein
VRTKNIRNIKFNNNINLANENEHKNYNIFDIYP